MVTKQRFSRQKKISWFDQVKIGNANCMIVGCGGIGSWTALQLTMLGVRKLVLVDMDNVEDSNLNRQFFYESDIKKFKAEVLAEKLEKINSKIQIKSFVMPIENVSDVHYENINFVFDCLDNIPTREHLSSKCLDLKIPFIHSACSDVIGEVQLVVKGQTKSMREYSDEMKKNEDQRSCKDFHPSVCTTNMIVASLQVDKFLDYLIRKDANKAFVNYIRGRGITYG